MHHVSIYSAMGTWRSWWKLVALRADFGHRVLLFGSMVLVISILLCPETSHIVDNFLRAVLTSMSTVRFTATQKMNSFSCRKLRMIFCHTSKSHGLLVYLTETALGTFWVQVYHGWIHVAKLTNNSTEATLRNMYHLYHITWQTQHKLNKSLLVCYIR